MYWNWVLKLEVVSDTPFAQDVMSYISYYNSYLNLLTQQRKYNISIKNITLKLTIKTSPISIACGRGWWVYLLIIYYLFTDFKYNVSICMHR